MTLSREPVKAWRWHTVPKSLFGEVLFLGLEHLHILACVQNGPTLTLTKQALSDASEDVLTSELRMFLENV